MPLLKAPPKDIPQPLTRHFEELRSRLLFCVIVLLMATVGGYFLVEPTLAWMAKPVGQFIFTTPTEALFIRLKIALGLGLVVSFPVFLYQAWAFVAIALKPGEKKLTTAVVPASFLLFFAGAFLAVYGVAPLATQFLLDFGSDQLRPLISVQAYLSFLVWMVVGFGVLFQVPIVVLALVWAGIVQAKQFRAYRKHVIVGLLVLAAVLTPGPDVVSQLILTVPAYLLFEISLWVATRIERK